MSLRHRGADAGDQRRADVDDETAVEREHELKPAIALGAAIAETKGRQVLTRASAGGVELRSVG